MTTLALHNIPDDLYRRLEAAAQAKRCSVDEEALQVLEKGMAREETAPLDARAFWHGYTLDQLAGMQQARPHSSLDDLAGDWPEEDSLDLFLASVQEARR